MRDVKKCFENSSRPIEQAIIGQEWNPGAKFHMSQQYHGKSCGILKSGRWNPIDFWHPNSLFRRIFDKVKSNLFEANGI